MNNNQTYIRCGLGGEAYRRFEKIKMYMGIENNTDLIRYLINQRYREIYPEVASEQVVEVEASS